MKVIDVTKLRPVECPRGGFQSFRAILAGDGMGFSMHRTVIPVGAPQHWHYKNHLEACYCISGHGKLTNLTTGQVFDILPHMVYVLDKNDDHTFQAILPVELISVFNPPVKGAEVHNEDGSYE